MARVNTLKSDLDVLGYIRAKGIYIDGRLLRPGEGGGGLSVDDLTSTSGSISVTESGTKISFDLSKAISDQLNQAATDASNAKDSVESIQEAVQTATENSQQALTESGQAKSEASEALSQISTINEQITAQDTKIQENSDNITSVNNLVEEYKPLIINVTPNGSVTDGSTAATDIASSDTWDKVTKGVPVVYKFNLGQYEYYGYATSIYKDVDTDVYSVRGHTIVPQLSGSIVDVQFVHEGNTVTLKYYPNFDNLKKLQINSDGKIDAANLPSYVDDVIEGVYSEGVFLTDDDKQIEAESGKIYIDKNTNKTYRYASGQYIPIGDTDSELAKKVDKLSDDTASLSSSVENNTQALAGKADKGEVESLQETINTQAEQIAALQEELIGQNATVNVSISPSNFLKYTQQNITLTASISYKGKTSDQIKDKVIGTINFAGDDPTSFTGVTSKSISKSVANTNKDSVSGSATITYQGVKFGPYTRTAYAQYPVYSGMSEDSEKNNKVGLSTMSARGSAAGTYSGTAAEGQYFYLIYPATMPNITSCKEGGFDAPLTQLSTISLNIATNNDDDPVEEVQYKVYRSANAFSAGSYNLVIS